MVERTVVLPRVHTKADEQDGRDGAERARQVGRGLRAAAAADRLSSRKLDGEPVGRHVRNDVAERSEHHHHGKPAALIRRRGVAGVRGDVGAVCHRFLDNVLARVWVDAPVGVGQTHLGEYDEHCGAERPTNDHVGLAPVPEYWAAVVDSAKEELEGPWHSHDDTRGGVHVRRHVEVAHEEAVDCGGQTAIYQADSVVLRKVAKVGFVIDVNHGAC